MARARRGRGEGAVYQRKSDGLWVGSVSSGYKSNGKRNRRMVYGKTKAEALAELAKARGATTIKDASGLSLGGFLDRWMADAKADQVSSNTYRSYAARIKLHIKPALGHVLLTKITGLQVQSFYASLQRSGLNGNTRHSIHSVLRQSLAKAVKWGLIPVNPVDAVDAPRVNAHKIRPLETEDEVKKYIAATEGERLAGLLILAIYSGARVGELLALTRKDINLEDGRVTINKSAGEYGVGKTKTGGSCRTVIVPQPAIDAIVKHRQRMLLEGLAGSSLEFPNTRGGIINRCMVRDANRRVLAAAGLPMIRVHDLRHSHATLLLKAGVHPKVVQERLGHTSIGMTMNLYSHVTESMQAEVATKLNKMFG